MKCETASTKMQFRNEKKKSTLMNIDMTRGQRSLCNLKNSLFPKEKTTPNAIDLRLYCHLIRTFQKLEEAIFSHSSLFLPHCLSRPSLSKTNMNLPKQ